ncbi:hypothetical protein Tco_1346008 [Tanacetum coccineum]
MVKNLDSQHKFLLYPRFIQLLLNKQQRLLLPHTRTYPTPTLTSKLFSNMRRASKGYSGVVTPLFENMLVQAHDEEQLQSPSRITSLPSLYQHTHSIISFQTKSTHHKARRMLLCLMISFPCCSLTWKIDGLERDLQQTKKTYSTALTKLVLRVKKLEYNLKFGKARRKEKIEEEVHEKLSDETEVLVQEETPIKIIEEHGSGEKGEMEISTANIQVSTASPPKVSTAVPHVYTRRSAKDKGKAIMEEPATPKKVKKRTQVQLSMDEELARKMEEEERIRFNAEQEARALQEEEERLNLEAARELQRQLDQRQEVPTQPTQSQGIDWNDPSVLRYHALKNRPVSIAQARRNMITYLKNQGGYKESYFKKMSYDDIRPIFERVWDHVNTFIPIGSEVEKDSSKPSERETSKIVEEREVEKKCCQDNSKRQKKEKETADYEEEKDELRIWLIVVPDEEAIVDPEVLHTKLVMEIFQDNTPEGYKLMLWGDLKILVYPEQDDDIWKNQNQWKIISWKLYETYGVHTLMVDGTLMTFHMFAKKKYPLTKETLQKMLN